MSMNLNSSHIIGAEKAIRSFSLSVQNIIPAIVNFNKISSEKQSLTKELLANKIFTFLTSSCNNRRDLMAIYEWMGLPKYEPYVCSKSILFFDFIRDYKKDNGHYRVLDKIIEDIKKYHKNNE